MQRRHGAHHQIRTQGGRVVDADIQARLDAGTHHHGITAGDQPDGTFHHARELGHHRGNNRPVIAHILHAAEKQHLLQQSGVFHIRPARIGLQAIHLFRFQSFQNAHAHMGVSNINC